MPSYFLSTEELNTVNVATLDQGPRAFVPVPASSGGGANPVTQIKSGGSSVLIPCDGTSTPTFSVMHTSQTGTRLIQCNFTGTIDYSGGSVVPFPGNGLFATLCASNFVPLVGTWEQAFLVSALPAQPVRMSLASPSTEPVFDTSGAVTTFVAAAASVVADFVLDSPDSNWSLGNGGRLVYNGAEDLECVVIVSAELENTALTGDNFTALAIAKNGDLVGTNPADKLPQGAMSSVRTASISQNPGGTLTTSRTVTISQDQYLEPVVALSNGAETTLLEAFSMVVLPLRQAVFDGSTLSGTFIAFSPAAVGVPEQVDVNVECLGPSNNPADVFALQGVLVVTDM